MPESTIQSIYAVGGQEGREHCGLRCRRLFGGGTWLNSVVRWGQGQRLGFGQKPMSREATGKLGDLGGTQGPLGLGWMVMATTGLPPSHLHLPNERIVGILR